ncbi:putative protein [Mycolicibacterium vanbaalenii]|uniref:DUF732 domain-containing protein n=2 Tax=Mycolicibacterium vanbaalenii TaxID=110539 RepID=A0A5S9QLF6_MYCVN|nr:putative protein [Mycolicibacterium vanbaalenii]
MMLAAGVLSILVPAAPAAADSDTTFTDELHTYGIYGQKDYNAFIGTITCKRLDRGVDKDADAAATFIHGQLEHGATTEQAWQFLTSVLRTYCPQQLGRPDAARP